MFVTRMRSMRSRPGRVRALCLAVVLAGGLGMFFGGGAVVSNSLGRGDDLSGRKDIWTAAFAAADNPLIGTGFESFWNVNGPKVNRSLHAAGYWDMSNLVSAHNGYLETYLDLGVIGVGLIVLILIRGIHKGSRAFERSPELGGLMVAYVTVAAFYSITEAGFRTLSPSWFFLLLAVVSASGIVSGLFEIPVAQTISEPTGHWNRQGNRRFVPEYVAHQKPSLGRFPLREKVGSARGTNSTAGQAGQNFNRFQIGPRHN